MALSLSWVNVYVCTSLTLGICITNQEDKETAARHPQTAAQMHEPLTHSHTRKEWLRIQCISATTHIYHTVDTKQQPRITNQVDDQSLLKTWISLSGKIALLPRNNYPCFQIHYKSLMCYIQFLCEGELFYWEVLLFISLSGLCTYNKVSVESMYQASMLKLVFHLRMSRLNKKSRYLLFVKLTLHCTYIVMKDFLQLQHHRIWFI